jgi:glycosyltransferase involved in cell wall biosynthesis
LSPSPDGTGAGAHVIRNGVDLVRFSPLSGARRDSVRQCLGLSPGDRVALCAGRLNDQKGQQVLVRGWPDVVRRVAGARLVLLGDGPLSDALRREAGQLGVDESVVFAPPVDDVEDWYAAADVVVLSSRYGEAMSLTPLEAMACARPVVATDVGGVRESVGDGCGAVVPPNDPGALSAEIGRRLGDPGLCEREGVAGRTWVEQHFDVREVGQRMATLTASLAGAA